MRKIVIALATLAGIVCLSGCTSDYYPYYYGHYSWAYSRGPFGSSSYYRRFYGNWDCVHHFDATYCARG
jgi:hypothetical protein